MSLSPGPIVLPPKIDLPNIDTPIANPKPHYSWREFLYKGVDYFSNSLFNNRLPVLISAFAIQAFTSREIPTGLAKSMSFSGAIIKPIKSAIFLGPLNIASGALLAIISGTAFALLGVSTDGPDMEKLKAALHMKKINIFKKAAKVAIIEELLFRFAIQGTLTSLAQSYGFLNTNTVKLIASTIFGLAHAKQNLTQAITAGVTSYYFEASLYEKEGLLSAIGVHFMNDVIAFSLF